MVEVSIFMLAGLGIIVLALVFTALYFAMLSDKNAYDAKKWREHDVALCNDQAAYAREVATLTAMTRVQLHALNPGHGNR